VVLVVEFEQFVAEQGPGLRRLAFMITGEWYAAEDLAQTALARAFENWDRVASVDRPVDYVRRILVRQHLSWQRKRASGELLAAEPGADRPVESGVDLVDARDAAWALLAALPRRQRVVLVLRYYEDLPDDQIARIVGTSASTVRSNASRALARLRAQIPGREQELLP
jgi:RNA polymerase sigma-70 factor (sigma-E family)